MNKAKTINTTDVLKNIDKNRDVCYMNKYNYYPVLLFNILLKINYTTKVALD